MMRLPEASTHIVFLNRAACDAEMKGLASGVSRTADSIPSGSDDLTNDPTNRCGLSSEGKT
jgi:hypothetical protein